MNILQAAVNSERVSERKSVYILIGSISKTTHRTMMNRVEQVLDLGRMAVQSTKESKAVFELSNSFTGNSFEQYTCVLGRDKKEISGGIVEGEDAIFTFKKIL